MFRAASCAEPISAALLELPHRYSMRKWVTAW
jgi:hypothetical protein